MDVRGDFYGGLVEKRNTLLEGLTQMLCLLVCLHIKLLKSNKGGIFMKTACPNLVKLFFDHKDLG